MNFTKEQFTKLLEISRILNSSLNLDEVLEKIITLTTGLIDAEAGSLILIDEPAQRLFFKTATGAKAREVSRFSLKIGEGIAGCVAQTGRPMLINDVTKDPHFQKEISETINFPTKSILCVPLKLHGKIVGVIEILNKINAQFAEIDTALTMAVAEQAAIAIENARMHETLGRQCRSLKQTLSASHSFVSGPSPKTKQLLELIDRVSPSDSTILITGETGSGKELVARMIHNKSKRKNFPFVCVTCAILTETLLESELFGHEKGAFTGATGKKTGKFELAHNGTVFLDEISAIPPATQTKLLRVLQEREFERVGGTAIIKVNIRIIAATNETLEKLVSEGKLREDLYYRLKVIEVPVLPLRDRTEDIPVLAEYYLGQFSRELDKQTPRIHPQALKLLKEYQWPGNIRELKNVMERAVVLESGNELLPQHLPIEIQEKKIPAPKEELSDWTLEALEKWHTERVLKHVGGNKSKAAKILGISRNRLDRKLK